MKIYQLDEGEILPYQFALLRADMEIARLKSAQAARAKGKAALTTLAIRDILEKMPARLAPLRRPMPHTRAGFAKEISEQLHEIETGLGRKATLESVQRRVSRHLASGKIALPLP